MEVVADHALLGLAVASLAAAALRGASLLADRGLDRVLAAAVLGATGAALTSLALGLVALGGSPVALVLAALAVWLATRVALPAPEHRVPAELASWWRELSPAERLLAGAATGAGLAWAAWLLRFPALGVDTVAYHLSQVVLWVQQGTPGSLEQVSPGYPFGSYPLTNELLMSWAVGLSQSLVPAALWAPAFLALLLMACWSGMRELGVPRLAGALALAALAFTPVLTHWQQNGAYSDLPALAWLVSCGALVAGADRRPRLLGAVPLAAALAVGTKTTTAPLALLLLAVAALQHRERLRALAPALAAATLAGLAVGGVWYLRNLVSHGSPLWPFVATPWGDAVPELMARSSTSFLERPRATLDQLGSEYVDLFATGMVVGVGTIAAAFAARTRAVLAAAVVTAAALALWLASPFTGVAENRLPEVPLSTLRYLLPALVAGLLALALAARVTGLARVLALAGLAAAAVVGVVQTFNLGFPAVPSPTTILAGVAVGGASGIALGWSRLRLPAGRPELRGPSWALVAVGAGALLAIPAGGFVERHAGTGAFGADVAAWLVTRPAFGEGDAPVLSAPVTLAPLTGDRLQHPLVPIERGADCRAVREGARGGWLVVSRRPLEELGLSSPQRCLEGVRPAHRTALFGVYGG